MIVFSHIEVGNYYYHTTAKSKEDSFRLIWGAFVFGNVFPDISKFASRKHFYEETRSIYKCFLMKALNPAGGDWERSMASGVVCHFLCDYFCKYHAKTPYTQKSMILHTLYEMVLHVKIKNILLKKSLGLLSMGEQSVFRRAAEYSGADLRGAEISFDLLRMIREYEGEDESLLTDMAFSFKAVRSVMKEILSAKKAVSIEMTSDERSFTYRATA